MLDRDSSQPSLNDMVVGFLRSEPGAAEPYIFADCAREAIETVLEAVFSVGEDPRPALDDLIRLACVLELELASPTASALLRDVLASDIRVMSAYGEEHCDEQRQQREATKVRWGGEVEVKQAPMFGAKSPTGTVKASSFIDPRRTPREKRPLCGVR